MDSIKHAGKYLNSKAKGRADAASKKANKSVAKDRNVRFSTRIRAAKNAAADKIRESKNKREAEVHKRAAKHNY